MSRFTLIISALCLFGQALSYDYEREKSPAFSAKAGETLYVPQSLDVGYAYAICSQSSKREVKCNVMAREILKRTCEDVKLSSSNYNVKLVSIYHFESKAILKWLEMDNDVVKNAKYTLVNSRDCSKNKELSFYIDKKETDSSYVNEMTHKQFGDVSIFVSSRSDCNGRSKCRLTYDEDFDRNGSPASFDIDLTHPVVRSEFFGDFYVRGIDSYSHKYKVYYMTKGGSKEELMSFDSDAQVINTAGSLLYTVCYTSGDKKRINYKVFAARNIATMQGQVAYPEAVEAIAVVNRKPETMFIVARKANCQGADCWNLYITMVKKNGPQKTKRVKVNCNGDKKHTIVSVRGEDDIEELNYGCEIIDEHDKTKSYYKLIDTNFE